MGLSDNVIQRSIKEFYPETSKVLFVGDVKLLEKLRFDASNVSVSEVAGLVFHQTNFEGVTLASVKLPARLSVEQRNAVKDFDAVFYVVDAKARNNDWRMDQIRRMDQVAAILVLNSNSNRSFYADLVNNEEDNSRVFRVSFTNHLSLLKAFDHVANFIVRKTMAAADAERVIRDYDARRANWKDERDEIRLEWMERKAKRDLRNEKRKEKKLKEAAKKGLLHDETTQYLSDYGEDYDSADGEDYGSADHLSDDDAQFADYPSTPVKEMGESGESGGSQESAGTQPSEDSLTKSESST